MDKSINSIRKLEMLGGESASVEAWATANQCEKPCGPTDGHRTDQEVKRTKVNPKSGWRQHKSDRTK